MKRAWRHSTRQRTGGPRPCIWCTSRCDVRRIEAESGPAAWSALEKDTAQALAVRGEPESALRHFLLAGATKQATELVSQLARPMLRQGRAGTLLQCLLDLPEAVVQDDLELL